MHGICLGIVSCLIMLAAGCAHAPPPAPCDQPEPITVALQAGEPLNPDDSGQSFPTIVRVYMLKSANLLETTSSDEVIRKDKEVLGGDLMEVQEVTVKPNAKETLTFKRQDEARQLAVVGLFRAPTGNTWRAIETLPAADKDFCHRPNGGARVEFKLQGNRVVFTPPPRAAATNKGAAK